MNNELELINKHMEECINIFENNIKKINFKNLNQNFIKEIKIKDDKNNIVKIQDVSDINFEKNNIVIKFLNKDILKKFENELKKYKEFYIFKSSMNTIKIKINEIINLEEKKKLLKIINNEKEKCKIILRNIRNKWKKNIYDKEMKKIMEEKNKKIEKIYEFWKLKI